MSGTAEDDHVHPARVDALSRKIDATDQELRDRITELEAENDALRRRIKRLEAEVGIDE